MRPREVISYVWPTLQRWSGWVQSWSLTVSSDPKEDHSREQLEPCLLRHFTSGESLP